MSVRVRLTRVGSKKNPIWRVVVADQRSPRDGRFIETIGHYNPQTEPSTIRIDQERLQHWLDRGAQPTGSVKQLVKAYAKSGGEPESASTAATAESVAVAEPAEDAAPESAAPGEPAPGAGEELDAEPGGPGPEPEDPAADAEDAVDQVEGEAPEAP
jgi:small subunit ribosomal protein S16